MRLHKNKLPSFKTNDSIIILNEHNCDKNWWKNYLGFSGWIWHEHWYWHRRMGSLELTFLQKPVGLAIVEQRGTRSKIFRVIFFVFWTGMVYLFDILFYLKIINILGHWSTKKYILTFLPFSAYLGMLSDVDIKHRNSFFYNRAHELFKNKLTENYNSFNFR